MICVYHKNCLDGKAAALAVQLAFGDEHTYIPCQYGDDVVGDFKNVFKDEHVIMVDFSLKRDQMIALSCIAASVLVIDHHKSAMKELDGIEDEMQCTAEVVFNMDRSGAVLAWWYFHPNKPVPKLFKHIQDRDLWKFELEGTKEICAGLMVHDNWRSWLSMSVDALWLEGSAIEAFLKQKRHETLQEYALMDSPFTDDKVPVYNLQGFMISDTLHDALEMYPDAPYALAYFDLPDRRVWSFRSRQGSDVDVSEIARQFRGGGHKHAAGCTGPREPLTRKQA